MLISNPWPVVLTRSALGLAATLLIGLIVGAPLLVFAIGAAGLLLYNLIQLYRLESWLRRSRKRRPPRAGGIWGNIFDGLDRQYQRQRERRYRLVRLLRRFRESVNAMPDGTILLTGSGEMDWWNQLATRYLGLHWPKDRGQRIANLIRHPDFAEYLEQGDWETAVKIPSPQDSRRTLEIRIVPYGQDQQLLLARDVSELHRLETMRRDFVGNISHELRTPLTVLRGMSEQLAEMDDLAPADLERPLALMEQQVDRMTRLVDDLLLLSRLETERPQARRGAVNINELLEDVVDEARAMSQGNHVINLTVDEGLGIAGEDEELRSAFSNLLSNAVKYTEPGGSIDVRGLRPQVRPVCRSRIPAAEYRCIIYLDLQSVSIASTVAVPPGMAGRGWALRSSNMCYPGIPPGSRSPVRWAKAARLLRFSRFTRGSAKPLRCVKPPSADCL